MAYFTYILQSLNDGSYYIGSTNDLEARLLKHNTAKSGYTSRKQPWKIVYFETFDSKTEAIKRELFLKKQRNKTFYQRLIDNHNEGRITIPCARGGR